MQRVFGSPRKVLEQLRWTSTAQQLPSCDEIGEACIPQVGEVSRWEQIDRVVAACTPHFGGIDMHFNNAGFVPAGKIHEIRKE